MTKLSNSDVESMKVIFRDLNEIWNHCFSIKVVENSLGCCANTVTVALISGTKDTGLRIVIQPSPRQFYVYQDKVLNVVGRGYSSRLYRSLTRVCCLAISIVMEQSISPRGDIETDDCDCDC